MNGSDEKILRSETVRYCASEFACEYAQRSVAERRAFKNRRGQLEFNEKYGRKYIRIKYQKRTAAVIACDVGLMGMGETGVVVFSRK